MLWANTKNWVKFAVLAAAISGALPLFGQTGGLTGDVRDDKGNALVGVTILIERQEIRGTYKVKTDKKGHYVYVGLPLGTYKITLQDTSGRALMWHGNVHVGMGDATVHDFDLAKEKAQQAKEAESNPEMKKQLEEQKLRGEEQKQFAGLKQLFDHGNELVAQAQAMQPAPSDPPEKRSQIDQDRQAKYAEAAAEFEKALPLAKDKNLIAVQTQLASSYSNAHQYDKALENYQKAIALDPSNADLHNALGNVYAQTNKIPEAQAEFQKSAELNPSGAARAYFNLGAIFYNTGKMDEAAQAFKKSTEIDPKNADAYALLGRALMGKLTMGADGKVVAVPGTVEALETYLKLDANGKYAQEAQADLQLIQGSVQTEYKVEKKKKK